MAPCLQESPTGHNPITVASSQHLFSQTPQKLTPRGQEILYATKHAHRHACLSGTLGSCVPSEADVTTLEPERARVGVPPAGFQAFVQDFPPWRSAWREGRPQTIPSQRRAYWGHVTHTMTHILVPSRAQ